MNDLNLMTLCSLIRKRGELVRLLWAGRLSDYEAARIAVIEQQIEDFARAIENDNHKRVIQ